MTRVGHRLRAAVPLAAETLGFGLAAIGLYQVYPPAALIFAGAALVFIAQGLERDE